MSKDINIDLKSLRPLLKKATRVLAKHAVFAALLVVLFIYILVVWHINQLVGAEPSQDAQTLALAKSTVPQINKDAISQIKTLEQTNTDVHSLFDQARNNPFQE